MRRALRLLLVDGSRCSSRRARARRSPPRAPKPSNDEFDLVPVDATAKPVHLAQGPDGNIWVALTRAARPNDVAKVRPHPGDGQRSTELRPARHHQQRTASSTGPDGNLWATHTSGVVELLAGRPGRRRRRPFPVVADQRRAAARRRSGQQPLDGAQATRRDQDHDGRRGDARSRRHRHDRATTSSSGGDGLLYIGDGPAARSASRRRIRRPHDGLAAADVLTQPRGNLQGVAAGPGNADRVSPTRSHAPEQIGRITPGNPDAADDRPAEHRPDRDRARRRRRLLDRELRVENLDGNSLTPLHDRRPAHAT